MHHILIFDDVHRTWGVAERDGRFQYVLVGPHRIPGIIRPFTETKIKTSQRAPKPISFQHLVRIYRAWPERENSWVTLQSGSAYQHSNSLFS